MAHLFLSFICFFASWMCFSMVELQDDGSIMEKAMIVCGVINAILVIVNLAMFFIMAF